MIVGRNCCRGFRFDFVEFSDILMSLLLLVIVLGVVGGVFGKSSLLSFLLFWGWGVRGWWSWFL